MKGLLGKLKASGLKPDELLNEGDHVHIGWKLGNGSAVGLASAHTLKDLEEGRAAGLKRVGEEVDRYAGGDPILKAQAENRFDANYNRIYGALKAQSDAAHQTLISGIDGDGQTKPTDLKSLFASTPGATSAWQYLTPSEQHGVLTMLNHNANPTPSQMTAAQLEAFQTLDGESKAKPDAFTQRNPMSDPLYGQLPNSYRIQLMKRRDTILAGKYVDGMTNTALKWVVPLLKGTDVENTAENADNYNKFASKLSDEVHTYYDAHKKAPSQVEVRQMTQELLLAKSKGFLQGEEPANYTSDTFTPAWFTTEAQAEAKARGLTLNPSQISILYQRRVARAR